MRLKRDRPNSAQPPKNPSYPTTSPSYPTTSPQAAGGNVPNRAMSVKQSRDQHLSIKQFSSLSTAYSNQGVRQRPSIPQDQTKLFPPSNLELQSDWDGEGGEGVGGGRERSYHLSSSISSSYPITIHTQDEGNQPSIHRLFTTYHFEVVMLKTHLLTPLTHSVPLDLHTDHAFCRPV